MGRVMVVDDEPDMRLAVRLILERCGHTVEEAASGEDACQRVQGAPPDLLLMDIRMPGQDGLDTLGKIRETNKSLPVIIMTGYGNPETEREAFRKGATDYILKPFKHKELMEAMFKAGLTDDLPVPSSDVPLPLRPVRPLKPSWNLLAYCKKVRTAAQFAATDFTQRYYESGRYLGDDSMFEKARHLFILIWEVIMAFFASLSDDTQELPDIHSVSEEVPGEPSPARRPYAPPAAPHQSPVDLGQDVQEVRQDLSNQIHLVAESLQVEIRRLAEQIASRSEAASSTGPPTTEEQEKPQEKFHRILIDLQTTWGQELTALGGALSQQESAVGEWRKTLLEFQERAGLAGSSGNPDSPQRSDL